MLGTDLCSTNEKVKRYDRKVMEYFQLEEKDYIYQELVERIREEMTPEMLADICDGCSWYPVSACREKILGKKKRRTEAKRAGKGGRRDSFKAFGSADD